LDPIVARLGTEDLAKLLPSFSEGWKGSLLVLASIANTTPSSKQYAQIFAFLMNNLHQQQHSQQTMMTTTTPV